MALPRPEKIATHDDSEDYFVPLTDQRVFGAGLKRKRVTFVPATDPTSGSSLPSNSVAKKSTLDIGDRYLSIVLGQQAKPEAVPSPSSQGSEDGGEARASAEAGTTPPYTHEQVILCPICNTPINPVGRVDSTTYPPTPHEASIIHQLHQPHSHPPSHLDRQRRGLKYLKNYGWDPDSRLGLGAVGKEGIREPVKAKEKRDTAGLGLDSKEDEDDFAVKGNKRRGKEAQQVVKKLNAKEVKRIEVEKKRKAEKLRGAFYGDDLERYLGPKG